MRIAILGKGRMGVLLYKTLKLQGHDVLGYIDEANYRTLSLSAQAVFDFSNVAKFPLLCAFLEACPCCGVIGTTGYTEVEEAKLRLLSNTHALCYSSNYSIGMQLMNKMLITCMPYLCQDYDIEIAEVHHRFKQDAPSGTTQVLLDTIKQFYPYKEVYGRAGMIGIREKEEIGIHSLRGGTMSGEHNVYFMGNDEELVLSHKTYSREVYVMGAIRALALLSKEEQGYYSFQDLLFREERG